MVVYGYIRWIYWEISGGINGNWCAKDMWYDSYDIITLPQSKMALFSWDVPYNFRRSLMGKSCKWVIFDCLGRTMGCWRCWSLFKWQWYNKCKPPMFWNSFVPSIDGKFGDGLSKIVLLTWTQIWKITTCVAFPIVSYSIDSRMIESTRCRQVQWRR